MASDLRVPLYLVERCSPPTTVAVTGVTGYMAGPIVQRLLAMGHTVHGTCRAPENTETTKHLTALPGASERLKLFQADLLLPESFDKAMDGCTIVIHTASPYIINIKPRFVRSRLIDPAVQGTENVLAAVDKAKTISRVVITSSIVAMAPDSPPLNNRPYTENDWNTLATEKVLPYHYSKTCAERRAWKIAKAQDRWRLVVINPPAIYGPPLSGRSDGESVDMVKRMANREMTPLCPMIGLSYADVRDIAAAHTLAAFHPAAQGRYLAVAGSTYLPDLTNQLAKAFPKRIPKAGFVPPKWVVMTIGPCFGIPRDIVKYTVDVTPRFDSSKIIKDFGFTFIPKSEMMVDQAVAMARLGIIKEL